MDANKYKFNLLPSPVDERDLLLESVYPQFIELPKVWDLRKDIPPVRDQGMQGTCSAQAASAMKEWQELTDYGFSGYMSPQFVYNLRVNQESEGMYPRDTMDILYKVGIVSEKDYPYNNFSPISDTLKSLANIHKIEGYAQINTLEGLKKSLYTNGPCYIAFPVYNANKMDFWKPDYPGQKMLGGHAVTVVGYLEDKFIIRNSWSSEWGDGGYCYYPFSDFGMHWELWTTIDADSNPYLNLEEESVKTAKVNFIKRFFNWIFNKF